MSASLPSRPDHDNRFELIAVYGPNGHIGTFSVTDTCGDRASQAMQIWAESTPEQRRQLPSVIDIKILTEVQADWRTATFPEFAEFQRCWREACRSHSRK